MTAATATEPDSWALVDDAQRGNRDAFGALYSRYQAPVFCYVMARTGDRNLAEDLTQDVFVRALRRIDSVHDQGVDLSAWLITIARNLVLDHFKSGYIRYEIPTAGPGEFTGPDQHPAVGLIAADLADDIRRHVGRLTEPQREVLRFRFWAELSVTATAEVMQRKEGAVKGLQQRAVVTLRRTLRDAA